MRKRNVLNNKGRFNSNNRRRMMLKRVHQKVLLRRQQFQQNEMIHEMAEAC